MIFYYTVVLVLRLLRQRSTRKAHSKDVLNSKSVDHDYSRSQLYWHFLVKLPTCRAFIFTTADLSFMFELPKGTDTIMVSRTKENQSPNDSNVKLYLLCFSIFSQVCFPDGPAPLV